MPVAKSARSTTCAATSPRFRGQRPAAPGSDRGRLEVRAVPRLRSTRSARGPALLYENVRTTPSSVHERVHDAQRIAIALRDPNLTMCQLSRKWMELTTKQMVKPVFRRQAVGDGERHRGRRGRPGEVPVPWFYPDPLLRHRGLPRDVPTPDHRLDQPGHLPLAGAEARTSSARRSSRANTATCMKKVR